MCYCFWTYFKS